MIRLPRVVLLLTVLFLGIGIVMSPPVRGKPRLLESARDHSQIGEVRTAWNLTQQALRTHPADPDVWAYYVRLAPRFQSSSRTRRVFRDVLARIRDPSPFVKFMRTTSTDTSSYTPLLEWAFTNEVYDTGLVELYASQLIQRDTHSRALEVLRSGLSRFPASQELTFLLARAHFGLGNCRRAGTLLRRLTQSRPGRARNYRWFSMVLLGQGQRNAARVLYGRYRALSGGNIPWKRFSRSVPYCR